MVCIHCGGTTQVTNSRPQKRLNQVWRRRKCATCGSVFTTEETVQYGATWMVSRAGSVEPFSRDRLFLSLLNSVQHRSSAVSDAAALADTVMQKLLKDVHSGSIDTAAIARIAQVALNRFDQAASVHYAAFHSSGRRN